MIPQQVYQTLRDGQIRLLRIHSPSDFTLEHIYCGDSTPYVAISHCWGDAEELCSVSINKIEVSLRKHVATMLSSLYEYHRLDCVWLDMVCINQRDLKEKAGQVSLIGQIYGKAEQVYAWLGKSDREIDNVFEVLRNFRDFKSCGKTPENMDAAERLSFYRESFRRIYQARIGLLPESSHLDDEGLHEEFSLLRPFFTIPYWSRVWIVQELILAKTVILCYGQQSISFDDIYGLSLDWGSFEQGFDAGVIQIAGRTDLKQPSRAWRVIQAICGHRRIQFVEWLEYGEGDEHGQRGACFRRNVTGQPSCSVLSK